MTAYTKEGRGRGGKRTSRVLQAGLQKKNDLESKKRKIKARFELLT